ncbi:MAG: DsbA family protein [Leucobacter sp.]
MSEQNDASPERDQAVPSEILAEPATEPAAESTALPSAPPVRRRGPVETLDRPTLLRRYRLLRNLVVLLTALVVLLGGVAITQLVQLQQAQAGSAAAAGQGGADPTSPERAGGEQTGTEQAGTDQSTTRTTDPGAADAGDAAGETAGECPVPERRDADDYMAIGDVDAPLVIAEWTDFRCPYCGVFSRDTLPTLIDEYIDTGKVRLEVHDVDFIDGDVSARVAVAARAAGEQGRYFDYLFAVYDDMHKDRPEITDKLLREYAEQAKVSDLARFAADLDSAELLEQVRASSEQARSFGVGSVPTFVDTSNCQALQGAQPVEQFRAFLDQAVVEAEAGRGQKNDSGSEQ